MVLRRLRGCGVRHSQESPARDVIPFPGVPKLQAEGAAPDLFWQDGFFWQNLLQFLILLVTGATWLILPFLLAASLVRG
jgi:hypothetical protein